MRDFFKKLFNLVFAEIILVGILIGAGFYGQFLDKHFPIEQYYHSGFIYLLIFLDLIGLLAAVGAGFFAICALFTVWKTYD